MRSAIAFALYLPLVVIAWLGWLMIDWAGTENRSIGGMAAAAALLGGGIWIVKRKWSFVIAPAAVVSLLLLCTVVDVSPVQPAAHAVRRIRVGMSETQVRAILNSEFPARLRPARMNRPLQNSAITFVLGSGSTHNAAVVQIQFVNDRVVTAKFLAD